MRGEQEKNMMPCVLFEVFWKEFGLLEGGFQANQSFVIRYV